MCPTDMADTRYWAKQDLYDNIARLMRSLRITKAHFPIKAEQLFSMCPDVKINKMDFGTDLIGGAIYLGKHKSTLLVNTALNLRDQNFGSMHEFVHYTWHPKMHYCCFEGGISKNNAVLEWQANEGAAQILVPYKDFIPRLIDMIGVMEDNYWTEYDLYETLAYHYQVNPVVINYRIASLDNEIYQYLGGTPINKIQFLSNRKKMERNIPLDAMRKIIEYIGKWGSMA